MLLRNVTESTVYCLTTWDGEWRSAVAQYLLYRRRRNPLVLKHLSARLLPGFMELAVVPLFPVLCAKKWFQVASGILCVDYAGVKGIGSKEQKQRSKRICYERVLNMLIPSSLTHPILNSIYFYDRVTMTPKNFGKIIFLELLNHLVERADLNRAVILHSCIWIQSPSDNPRLFLV